MGTRPRFGRTLVESKEQALAELPLLERGSSATKPSHAVKSANIRLIKRRRIGPVPAYTLDHYKLTTHIKRARKVYCLLTFVSHIGFPTKDIGNDRQKKRHL